MTSQPTRQSQPPAAGDAPGGGGAAAYPPHPLTVGQVADELGVTVRTLHHYDEIGLVVPSERSHSGCRLYTAGDLQRLQHVVVYRRLGLPLEEIAGILADPTSVTEHLTRQRKAVTARLSELRDLVTAIDKALEREMTKQPATPDELREIFGTEYDTHKDEYEADAQQRWGDTPQWKQSQERTARYTKDDWARLKSENDEVNAAFVAAKRSGAAPTSEAAMDAAEAARVHMVTWFYDTSHEFHRGLGDMYAADPRFASNYEALEPGLATYIRDAIHANADRHAG